MKSDIDRLMQARDIDALWVMGAGDHNPAMVYLTGGGHLTRADLIQPCGKPGTLFHGPMERDEAAKTGFQTRSYASYPRQELLRDADGDAFLANVLRAKKMLIDAGVTSGKVAIYGQMELGPAFAMLNSLARELPDLEFIGYQEQDILAEAMMTKGADEFDRIQKMGQVTISVVGQTAEFLSQHAARQGYLVKGDGQPLTIGDVKRQINLWLAESGAENPEGTIFAIGRDSGVPHSSGNAEDRLALGQTIVFDIFPCEQGGGYFYDFTRTWCLGYAPDEAYALYDQVKSVYTQVLAALQVNEPFKRYQKLTCDLFEAQGHPTVQVHPTTEIGYVHSLGHGVGLKVHERPASGAMAAPGDLLAPGVVATIEPGLYYPERGLGVRLEDTIWVTPDGKIEVPAPYPLDLVLPVKSY